MAFHDKRLTLFFMDPWLIFFESRQNLVFRMFSVMFVLVYVLLCCFRVKIEFFDFSKKLTSYSLTTIWLFFRNCLLKQSEWQLNTSKQDFLIMRHFWFLDCLTLPHFTALVKSFSFDPTNEIESIQLSNVNEALSAN